MHVSSSRREQGTASEGSADEGAAVRKRGDRPATDGAGTAPPPVMPRALEVGHAVRTAYCGYLLARLGSTVTKLVSQARYSVAGAPDSPPARREDAAAVFLDRGKAVRVTVPGSKNGAEARGRLLANSDVLLLADRDDAERWFGHSREKLEAENPRLIVATASNLGERGDYARMIGGEQQALALSGLLSMIGEKGRPPLALGGPQAEHAAAAALFSGIMLALYAREDDDSESTASVSTSTVRAAAYLDWKSHIHYVDDGRILQRGSDAGPVVLRCADGSVGFYYRDEDWPKVKRLVDDQRLDGERFCSQRSRDLHRAEFVALLEEFSRSLTREELYHHSQALGIPAGPVLSITELPADRQLAAREFLLTESHPRLGQILHPRAPWTVNGRREASA